MNLPSACRLAGRGRLAVAALILGLGASLVRAGVPPNRAITSRSGQFVVVLELATPPPRSSPTLQVPQRGNPSIELTPETLIVTCERVKTGILRWLDLPDRWRGTGEGSGKILVGIDSTVRTNEPLVVATSRFEQGWRYSIALPPTLSEDRLVRVLTQAILTELGSRAGNSRTGEPPLWLVEGITQEMLSEAAGSLVAQPQTRQVSDLRLGERLARVRSRLARDTPLAFHQLSQPEISRMEPRDWEVYSACAHLFVRELSRLPEGTSRTASWLLNMQQYWNWQSGFIEAFDPTFRSLLDVEKWWAITLANFTGRTAAQAWPAEFTLKKLDEALQPVGILPSAGNRATRLTLESVISDWDFGRQIPVLRRFLQQMQAIAFNAPPALRPLVLHYADAVDEYLNERRRTGYAPIGRGQAIPTARSASREAVARLRELEGERRRVVESLERPAIADASAEP